MLREFFFHRVGWNGKVFFPGDLSRENMLLPFRVGVVPSHEKVTKGYGSSPSTAAQWYMRAGGRLTHPDAW